MRYGLLLGLTSFLLIFLPVFVGFVGYGGDLQAFLVPDIGEVLPFSEDGPDFEFVGFEPRDEEFMEVDLVFRITSPIAQDVTVNTFRASIRNHETQTLLGSVSVEDLPLVIRGEGQTTVTVLLTTTEAGRAEIDRLRGQELYIDVGDIELEVEGITIDVETGIDEIGPIEIP